MSEILEKILIAAAVTNVTALSVWCIRRIGWLFATAAKNEKDIDACFALIRKNHAQVERELDEITESQISN